MNHQDKSHSPIDKSNTDKSPIDKSAIDKSADEIDGVEDDANYEIGVTEESFSTQARGAFGQANELISSVRR